MRVAYDPGGDQPISISTSSSVPLKKWVPSVLQPMVTS